MLDRSKYMDEAEIEQLVKSCREWESNDLRYGKLAGIKIWLLVDVALSTGLRVAELANLQAADFDAKQRSLKVVRVKKKKKVAETLPISKDLADHLKTYLNGRKTGTIFGVSRATLQQQFHSAINHAHLPKALSIHSCRHSLAVRLLKATGNLRLVQLQLGHSSPQTTAIYADIAFADRQAALDKLNE
ncbi:MAG: site-specific integrase [Planctomycetota bacterium]